MKAALRFDAGSAAGVLGIVVPAAGLAVLPIWEFPPTDVTSRELVRFVTVHQDALQVLMVLNTIGVTLWAVFGAGLWVRVRDAEGPGSGIALCVAMGFAGFTTLLLGGFTAFNVLVYRGANAQAPVLLYDLTFGLLAMSGMPTAIAVAAYAVAVLRGRLTLPRWTAYLAIVTAVAHVLLLFSFVVPSGFLSLQGAVITVIPGLLWVWILATALAMAGPGRTSPDVRRAGLVDGEPV